MAKYKVENTSQFTVFRGNIVFPGLRITVVELEPGSVKYIEIKACCKLKFRGVVKENKEVNSVTSGVVSHIKPEDVVVKVTEESEVEPIENVVKEVESIKKDDNVLPPKGEVVINIVGNDSVTPDGNVSCPYCDFIGTKMGLYHHVRSKHNEKYDEFKEMLKSAN